MSTQDARRFSRRTFLGGLTLAGTAGLLGLYARPGAAEPPPETTKVKLVFNFSGPCTAPLHLTEESLHGEGFSEVQYVNTSTTVEQRQAVASGEADLTQNFLGPSLLLLDAGDLLVLLAGVHIGCLELFGHDRVRGVRDLKGKTVAVPDLGGSNHVFLSSVAAYVGLDPRQDITWVTQPHAEAARLLVERKIDAVLAGPPEAQLLRAQQIGHVILNTMMDRPWSQYFCCMVTGNRAFVRKYPVATKRALRAIFRAVDRYTGEPELLARFLVDRGYRTDYNFALQALQERGMAYGT
jgi:NitT/TauT family transport system substrate-binding protein